MSELHVLFKVGGSEYAVAASEVLHLESFVTATKVPGAPAHVTGLMQVRGRVVPIIDLRQRFGVGVHEPSSLSRVLVVQVGARAVALLADSAREVMKIDTAEFREAPEMVVDAGQGFVKSVTQTGGRLIMLVDLEKVVGEENTDGH
ncbi:MAG TPA: chemotaxis protein CheW [Polyangia bacterium]